MNSTIVIQQYDRVMGQLHSFYIKLVQPQLCFVDYPQNLANFSHRPHLQIAVLWHHNTSKQISLPQLQTYLDTFFFACEQISTYIHPVCARLPSHSGVDYDSLMEYFRVVAVYYYLVVGKVDGSKGNVYALFCVLKRNEPFLKLLCIQIPHGYAVLTARLSNKQLFYHKNTAKTGR